MSDKQVSPAVKIGLELGPVFLFFVGYITTRGQTYVIGGTEYDAFILLTAAFIPLMAVATFVLWKLSGRLSRLQLVTLVMVVLFGGLTVWLNDERFFKMKPTAVYMIFALLLALGLSRGQSWLEMVMEGALPLTHDGWMLLTKRLALMFAAMACTNEIVWRTMSTDAWVNFRTFVLPLALFGFFMAQAKLFERYSSAPKD
ncbi:MAG: septation protein IspZ [Roseinatronobacter sp.]|jgi:intracellular septation protein|uniref:Inner membrane-spanning protein YciB n=1 Tax=Roseinatronobacter monicus TaxID=393481 RepID=A0A543KCU4_9RHOB|nr:inner membrane-spanning protein YciB [Roseinatronobacter monicus]TQM92892.1 intracellular septation protein [Roseinatronobacter monicus]TVQ01861.1 MAG: septation protein IspZ [Roseinatronobacter sp.]